MARPALTEPRQQLNVRIPATAHTKLKAIASVNGRSVPQEMEHLIGQAAEQHDQFGGPQCRRIVYAMGSSFVVAGQFSAGEGVPAEQWLQDTGTVATAIASAVDALARTLPCLDSDDALRLLKHAIDGRLATRAAQRRVK